MSDDDATPATATVAQITAAIDAVTASLATVRAMVTSPDFQGAAVVAEDIEGFLADFDVPGAAIAQQATEAAAADAPAVFADVQAGWSILGPAVGGLLAATAPAPTGIAKGGRGSAQEN